MTYIVTEFGKLFSVKGIGNRVSDWLRQAGLPHPTAHSIRKGPATDVAHNEATDSMMEAMFGWPDGKTSRIYIRNAERARLTRQTVARIQWELERSCWQTATIQRPKREQTATQARKGGRTVQVQTAKSAKMAGPFNYLHGVERIIGGLARNRTGVQGFAGFPPLLKTLGKTAPCCVHVASIEQGVSGVGEFAAVVSPREQVAVGVHRHEDRGVAEPLLNHLRRQAEPAIFLPVDAP